MIQASENSKPVAMNLDHGNGRFTDSDTPDLYGFWLSLSRSLGMGVL